MDVCQQMKLPLRDFKTYLSEEQKKKEVTPQNTHLNLGFE